MKLFCTTSVAHLVDRITSPRGSYILKKFSDGELYVKIDEFSKNAWVIASTFPPADNMLQLFFLLDALQRTGATINLLIPYFGYARQSHPQQGEAASVRVICNFLKEFELKRIIVIHIHTKTVHEFLPFENVIPFELICKEAEKFDCIASSDRGSAELAQMTGVRCEKPTIYIEKVRPSHETVEIVSITGDVRGKSVLIVDDIIATGTTMSAAAQTLLTHGAAKVCGYATHAFFTQNAVTLLEQNVLEKIYVTNTIPQQEHSSKIEVLDIAPLLQKIIDHYRIDRS